MTFQKLLCSVILSLAALAHASHAEELSGSALSAFVEKTLSKSGIKAEREPLSKTGSDVFAYNVRAKIHGKSDKARTLEEIAAGDAQELRDTVILCFTQEDFVAHQEKIIPLLEHIKKSDTPCAVHALFSALDGNERFAIGSRMAAQNFDDAGRACALLFSFNGDGPTSVQNGSTRNVTPLWLYERVIRSFKQSGIAFSFPGNMISLYRIALLDGEKRMDAFAQSGIPSVFITFRDDGGLESVHDFLDKYDSEGTNVGDTHYFYVPFPSGFFIGETALVRLVLIIGTMSLFLLCAFSFSGKYGAAMKRDFLRTIYFLPLMLAFYAGSFCAGQVAARQIGVPLDLNPILLLALKFFVAIVIVIALSALFHRLKISIATFTFAHAVVFVAIANIFIFSLFDILFFIPFTIEFIIIYLSRSVRKSPFLLLVLILMILPFDPYVRMLFRGASDEALMLFSLSSLKGNALLALGLFPFMIQLQKILFRLFIYADEKSYPAKKSIVRIFLPSAAGFLLVYAALTQAAQASYRLKTRGTAQTAMTVREEAAESLSASITQSEFQGVRSNHLVINSSQDAFRYNVRVESKGEVPVYDSFYDFFSNGDAASFIIPDFPPKKITIDFTSSATSLIKITVTALYKTEFEGEFVRQSIYIEPNFSSH